MDNGRVSVCAEANADGGERKDKEQEREGASTYRSERTLENQSF